MRILYTIFFSILILFLYASLVLYAVCAFDSFFKDKEESLSNRLFALVVVLGIDVFYGWALWEGFKYIISEGP